MICIGDAEKYKWELKKLSQATEQKARRVPILYKYYGLARPESLHRLIVKSEIYFPSIDDFNDPFDCKTVPIFDATKQQKFDFVSNYFRSVYGTIDPKRRDDMIKHIDSKKGKEEIPKAFRSVISRLGILSMTTHPNHMLMWSHYANGHTGVAIKFDRTIFDLPKANKDFQLMEVDYKNHYPKIRIFEINLASRTIDGPDRIAKTKSISWKYEDEWRLVANNSARQFVKLPETAISGLIFGLCTPDWLREAIIQWNGKRLRHLELLKIQNKPKSFKLEVVPV